MENSPSHSHHNYDNEMLKHMKMIANANRADQVILRAILAGIFTALGTTIGFAILIVILAQSVTGLRQIPIVDQFLRETKLDLLIEAQLANVRKEVVSGDPNSGQENGDSGSEVTELTYNDSEVGFGFSYPSTLTTFREITNNGGNSKQIRFSGEGSLQAFDVYVNDNVVIFGSDSTQQFITRNDIDRITVQVFETGATVADLSVNNAVFYTQFTAGSNTYTIIGIADAELPKIGREVFLSIIRSFRFTNL